MPRPFSAEHELILFSDESVAKGKFYSNFYGGVLVGASQFQRVNLALQAVKDRSHLTSEVKWSKVTPQWLDGYKALIDCFFSEIEAQNLMVRIMFRQNALTVPTLTEKHLDNEYFLLYYQFIKHAFGLDTLTTPADSLRLRLYFDQFPHTKVKVEAFKGYLLRLQESKFKNSPLKLDPQDITEVRSHDHILLQCLDVVLGAMAFRLNDLHKERQPGSRLIPKRTKAKLALYQHILSCIHRIKPRFNIGVSTAPTERYPDRRHLPYAHWAFQPKNAEYDHSVTKSPTKK